MGLSRCRRGAIMVCVCIAKYFLKASYSIIVPFYPVVALDKGVDPLTVGFIMASFAFVSFLIAPPLAKSIPIFGYKFIFILGVGVSGLAALIFGLLYIIDNTIYFTIMSFIVRIIQAFGVQAGNTSVVVIVFKLYPDNVAFAYGITQVFSGLGLITGPTIGAALYTAGGYFLPFLVLGVVLLVIAPICMCILPPSEIEDNISKGNWCPLLVMPGIILAMLIRVVSAIEITFLDSTLALALINLNVTSTGLLGILFLLTGLGYGLSAPLWGLAGDKWDIIKELNLLGLVFGSVGYLLIGPSPILQVDASVAIMATGLTLMGIGVGAVITLVSDMVTIASQNGIKNDITLFSLVSGLYYFAYNLGMCIGPIMGSGLAANFGFAWSCTYVSIMVAATFLIYAIYVGYNRCKEWRHAERTLQEKELEMNGMPTEANGDVTWDYVRDDHSDYDEEKNPFYTAPLNYSSMMNGDSR